MDRSHALVPMVSGLTNAQIDACDVFALKVFGTLMFMRDESHNGRHGYACPDCLHTLRARDSELERAQSIRQPWELAA